MTKLDNSHPEDYLPLILTAPVYDVCDETPLTRAGNLSTKFNCNFLLKREDLQPVFSFKLRGAYTCLKNLTAEEKANGVVACSAGNHAQGVALAAQKLGINAKIVMPLATPAIKWENVKRLGATVVLYGNDFDEAKKECMRLVEEEKRINIPPYDHPQVIAGQGTVAVEILRQCSMGKIDAIFCCVGGGGLISGVAAYVKRLYPNIKIIGVETVDSYAMFESLKTGKPVELQQVGLFADGAAVRLVGNETFRLCYEHLDGHILVTNDEICAAIKDIFEDTRSIVEPAGALSVAGLKKWIKINEGKQVSLDSLKFTATPDPNQRFLYNQKHDLLLSNKFIPSELTDEQPTYIAVTSGANMNFNRLRFVADRAELGLNKEALISVVIPERPGAFIALHNLILPRAITSFTYRYSDPDHAYIFSSFSLSDPSQKKKEIRELFEQLEKNGMQATDLTNNELAKDHGRFLIGGRASVPDERLYRFEFPERPDALFNFLKGLKFGWNVSLFQYRNTGGDTGKVLVGIQVPEQDLEELNDFLVRLNYPFVDETNNYVFTKFLTQ